MSPVLVPIWFVGLCRLFGARMGMGRDGRFRAFGWAFVLLAIFFVVSGGKPYYLIGLYPVLFAAGAEPTVAWVRRGGSNARRICLTAMLALSLIIDSVISLPVLPVRWLADSPVLAMNPDAGETAGWSPFVDTVAGVYRAAPEGTVILTGNYGEAGAVDQFGPAQGLPQAYSGHNGFGLWGPPSDNAATSAAGTAVVVGLTRDQLLGWFSSVQQKATIDNGIGLDNDEQGQAVWLCTGLKQPWSQIWPSLQRLG